MGVISDEAISHDSESVGEKKKKETGEVTAEGEGEVPFDQTEQKEPEEDDEQNKKSPMGM